MKFTMDNEEYLRKLEEENKLLKANNISNDVLREALSGILADFYVYILDEEYELTKKTPGRCPNRAPDIYAKSLTETENVFNIYVRCLKPQNREVYKKELDDELKQRMNTIVERLEKGTL